MYNNAWYKKYIRALKPPYIVKNMITGQYMLRCNAVHICYVAGNKTLYEGYVSNDANTIISGYSLLPETVTGACEYYNRNKERYDIPFLTYCGLKKRRKGKYAR